MGIIMGLHQTRTISVHLPVPDKQVDGKKIGKNWSCWYESDLLGSDCVGSNDL